MHRLVHCWIVALILIARAQASAEYTEKPGTFEVGSVEQIWHDSSRNRDVPVKIYFPKVSADKSTSRFPIIIFSHGLGGSREGYSYLSGHWASYGYISVHLQHHGSDKDIIRGLRPLKALREAAAVPANAINRPIDIQFSIDRLTALNEDSSFPLRGQLDLSRIGVAGHSFGAFTTMAIAGAHIPVLGEGSPYLDSRVKAGLAMSTPASSDDDSDSAFDSVRIPVFHMTGTEDESPKRRRNSDADPIVGDTTAAERLRPFRHTKQAPAYLLVFEGGDHMVFSGRLTASRSTDQEFQARILSASTAFWDAWLKEDSDARHWLDDGGFSSTLSGLGTFELSRAN